MYKRKLAALIAASFAGLMLSSPSFAQNTSGGPTSAQNTAPAAGAPESRSIERADEKAATSESSRNTEMKNQSESNLPKKLGAPESQSTARADKQAVVSKKAAAAAKADYQAAVAKCDAQPATARGACVQEAKDAQTLAMNKVGNDSPATRGAPESRSAGPQSAK
jgi:hypothetical protein